MTDALQLKHKILLFSDTAIISTLNKLSTFVSLVQYAVVKAIFSNLTQSSVPLESKAELLGLQNNKIRTLYRSGSP